MSENSNKSSPCPEQPEKIIGMLITFSSCQELREMYPMYYMKRVDVQLLLTLLCLCRSIYCAVSLQIFPSSYLKKKEQNLPQFPALQSGAILTTFLFSGLRNCLHILHNAFYFILTKKK